jgi:hypothetical protein
VIAIVDPDDVADAVVAGDPTVAARAKIPTITPAYLDTTIFSVPATTVQ